MAPSSLVTNILRRHQNEESCCRHPKRNRPKLSKLSLKMPPKTAAPNSVAATAPKVAKTAKSAALPSPMHPPYLQVSPFCPFSAVVGGLFMVFLKPFLWFVWGFR